jgi:ubiquinone/menaquinone biosynthesis C-methylase UbiE
VEGPLATLANDRPGSHLSGANRTRGVLPPFIDLASEYDRWFDREGRCIFLTEARALAELSPELPKPWLEIGVGSGRFAQALGTEAGLDPSIKMVELARTRGVNAFVGRGEQMLFDEESFGTVFLITTLCFLNSPRGVIKEANRILMPGGKMVLGLVLKESPWGQLYERKKASGHRFYRYATFYSFDEVARLLAQTGFVMERVVSTLFEKPERAHHVEKPQEGYSPDAGFTVILAGRQPMPKKRRRQVG